MPTLWPCPGCARHVRQTEVECPFCGRELSSSAAGRLATRRLAAERWAPALLAFASVGATVSACRRAEIGGSVASATPPVAQSPTPSSEAAPSASEDALDLELLGSSIVPAYGAPPLPSGPPAIATLGPLQARGGPIANAERVVSGMRSGFRSCYQQRGLTEVPDLAGSLHVEIAVRADGSVGGATTTTAASPRLKTLIGSCIEARAVAAQFDPPAGKPSADLAFDVRFGPLPPPPPEKK